MEELSALNNSSVNDDMSLEEILRAADERTLQLNEERSRPTGTEAAIKEARWLSILDTARALLPVAIKPFVFSGRDVNRRDVHRRDVHRRDVHRRDVHREDQPNEVAVAIDLPGSARIFFGPWQWDEASQEFKVEGPWRNKPFQVAGGNMEEFGDLLDAIARAREIYRMWQSGEAQLTIR